MIALDSNILLRMSDATSPQNAITLAAIGKLQLAGEQPVIFPQNVYEFWTTATRPLKVNGLGLDVPACLGEVNRYLRIFTLLPDQPDLFDEWFKLIVRHQCSGKVSYDARIVAAMNTHGITTLLTFNTADFARYPGLTALDPAAV